MCGITGIILQNPNGHSFHLPEVLKGMTAKIRHRGPDGEGFWFLMADQKSVRAYSDETPAACREGFVSIEKVENSRLGFGHRRLSILDLSVAGHQPMSDRSGDIWLTFNGEIYNYVEIRTELQKLGHVFHTETDTEVLIAAYREWGRACLSKFNGMWAFVLYDARNQLLWGARDRTGVKPFYYYFKNGIFAFASEPKALLSAPFVSNKLNRRAAFDYFFLNQLDESSETLFEDIVELPVSSEFTLGVQNFDFKISSYYKAPSAPAFEMYDEKKFQENVLQVRALLEESVRLRLRSDVAVGSCLSGGIDSSSIVCLINDLLKQGKGNEYVTQKVFTSCYDDERYDEQKWAAEVVKQTGVSWVKTFPDAGGLATDLENLIYCQDAPTTSTRTFAQFSVMKSAAENGIKVLLDGQGSDELFSGYQPHDWSYQSELMRHFHFLDLLGEWKQNGGIVQNLKTRLKENVKNAKLPAAWKDGLQKRYYPELSFLQPALSSENMSRYEKFSDRFHHDLDAHLRHEYFDGPLKFLLRCEDRCSMWFSIESRTPFADDLPLMDYVFGEVPASHKIKNGYRKHLLREAMRPYLPDSIRTRKDKMGFNTPNNQWINHLKEQVKPYFFEQDLSDVFDMKILEKNYDSFFSPESPIENFRIFKFIAFAVWRKIF